MLRIFQINALGFHVIAMKLFSLLFFLVYQVTYKAQMIRTWSLLLRAAGRAGTVLPRRPESEPLQEHTYILHPVEEGKN